MTVMEAGTYFAWGDTIYRAIGRCEVARSIFQGDTEDVLRFDEDFCTEQEALAVCAALKADTTYCVLGSDSGETGDPDDEGEGVA